jgi:hypothetical protein
MNAGKPSPKHSSHTPIIESARRTLLKPFRFFATGEDKPLLSDQREIDRLYKRYRIAVMTWITLGYGVAYTCRLGLY